jgi:hypothetical protein
MPGRPCLRDSNRRPGHYQPDRGRAGVCHAIAPDPISPDQSTDHGPAAHMPYSTAPSAGAHTPLVLRAPRQSAEPICAARWQHHGGTACRDHTYETVIVTRRLLTHTPHAESTAAHAATAPRSEAVPLRLGCRSRRLIDSSAPANSGTSMWSSLSKSTVTTRWALPRHRTVHGLPATLGKVVPRDAAGPVTGTRSPRER